MKYFEEKYRQHQIYSIEKTAKDLGFAVTLTPSLHQVSEEERERREPASWDTAQ
jgi:hypothetical protein